jgi:hypothetical protein
MDEARRAVFKAGQRPGEGGANAAMTPGELAIEQKAGVIGVDPGIRQEVDAETQNLASASGGFVDSLLFWRAPPTPGQPVDADAESKRVQADQVEGKPITAPQPVIERTQRSLLEGLF